MRKKYEYPAMTILMFEGEIIRTSGEEEKDYDDKGPWKDTWFAKTGE